MERSSNEAEGDGDSVKSLVVSRRQLFEHMNANEPVAKATRVVGKISAATASRTNSCNSDGEDESNSRRVNNCVNSSDISVNDSDIDVTANQPEDRLCEKTTATVEDRVDSSDKSEDEDCFRDDSLPDFKSPQTQHSPPVSKRFSYNTAVSKGRLALFPTALKDELSSKINAIKVKRGGESTESSEPEDQADVAKINAIKETRGGEPTESSEPEDQTNVDSLAAVRVRDNVNTDHASTDCPAITVVDVVHENNEDLSMAKLTENKLSVISSSPITDNCKPPDADGENHPGQEPEDQDYPEELNPFGDDDQTNVAENSGNPFDSDDESEDKSDQKSATSSVKINTNPFWSGSEEEEEEGEKDVPSLDRTSVNKTPIPLPRRVLPKVSPSNQTPNVGNVNPDESTCTAVPSPSPTSSCRSLRTQCRKLSSDSSDVSFQRSPGSQSVNSTIRKKRPPPPPPPVAVNAANNTKNPRSPSNEQISETVTVTASPVPPMPEQKTRKTTTSPWKHKKGPAPARPIPLRRPVKEMPIEDIQTELSDIEIRQQELERQSKQVDQMIRDRTNADDAENSSSPGEELVLQHFELVNEKNELLRRQSELMYMRKMHNLEKEHAEIEYQYRCLMLEPEKNKTDCDKTREEELLKRLLEVVEQRNEIIEAMDKDRQRERAEDKSVTTQLDEKQSDTIDDKAGKKQKKSKKDKVKKHKEEDSDKHESSKHSPSKVIKQKFMTLRHSAKKLSTKSPAKSPQ